MNVAKVATFVARRTLATSAGARKAAGEVHPGYIKLREQYAKFQIPDGVPVHLKGGVADRMLATFTYMVTAFGVGVVCYTLFYKMAFPQNRK